MADIKAALDIIIGEEGGYSDHPADKGGKTNMGVTQAALDRAKKARPKAGYPESVRDLTRPQVEEIYELDYAPKGWAKIDNQGVATAMLDVCINSGPARGVTLMQRALCAIGASVAVDGKFGPASLEAMNAADPHTLMAAFTQGRKVFYHHCVDADPTQAVFLKGWLNRADRIGSLA